MLLTLPFSFYNRIYFYRSEKLSTIDTFILFLSIIEFIFYMITVIFYFLKPYKVKSVFNVAFSFTIFYMLSDFILKTLHSKILTSNDLSYNVGYVGGIFILLGLMIFLTSKINFYLLTKNTEEISEIGPKENDRLLCQSFCA